MCLNKLQKRGPSLKPSAIEATKLELLLKDAINEFNRLHGAEAQARIVEVADRVFKVEMRGSFRSSCCFYDYFEDLVYELERLGVKSSLVRVEELEDGGVAEYRLEGGADGGGGG